MELGLMTDLDRNGPFPALLAGARDAAKRVGVEGDSGTFEVGNAPTSSRCWSVAAV